MKHYIVRYEPVDVIAESREDAIEKVKDICPSISRVELAEIKFERQEDGHKHSMQTVFERKNKH